MRVILAAPLTNGRAEPPFYRNLLEICPNCREGAAEALANGSDRVVRFLNYYRLQRGPQGQDKLIWSIPFLATVLYYDSEERLPALETRIAEEIRRVGPDEVSLALPKPWKPEETLLIIGRRLRHGPHPVLARAASWPVYYRAGSSTFLRYLRVIRFHSSTYRPSPRGASVTTRSITPTATLAP